MLYCNCSCNCKHRQLQTPAMFRLGFPGDCAVRLQAGLWMLSKQQLFPTNDGCALETSNTYESTPNCTYQIKLISCPILLVSSVHCVSRTPRVFQTLLPQTSQVLPCIFDSAPVVCVRLEVKWLCDVPVSWPGSLPLGLWRFASGWSCAV